MAEREQERRARRTTPPDQREDVPAAKPDVQKKGAALKKSLDEVLDEIDTVLEDNAEEFVKNYVQRGGE